jgi:predicted nucleotidyltransferase component of viral defense system
MKTVKDFKDLTPEQSALLAYLDKQSDFYEHFYFTGGTLLKALGISPRNSNDLDFFTFALVEPMAFPPLLKHMKTALETVFGAEAISATDRGFLHTESGMLVDCIFDTTINIRDFRAFGNLSTASLEDIAASKASALCCRDEVKDYIDIAFLTQEQQWTLKDLEQLAEEKFHLGTLSEEKLLTELLSKQELFTIPPEIFLRDAPEHIAIVTKSINRLLSSTSL